MFSYHCPDCRTESNLHDHDCRFERFGRPAIEVAYVEVLSALRAAPRTAERLREAIEWDELHEGALGALRRSHRVTEREEGRLDLLTGEERQEKLSIPDQEPLKTIYERGSVKGCHDNAVFAMVSYYEMVGLPWDETREKVSDWLRESGAWDRGGFEEASPEEVVDGKRHVHEHGYGWKEKAKAAKRVIDREL